MDWNSINEKYQLLQELKRKWYYAIYKNTKKWKKIAVMKKWEEKNINPREIEFFDEINSLYYYDKKDILIVVYKNKMNKKWYETQKFTIIQKFWDKKYNFLYPFKDNWKIEWINWEVREIKLYNKTTWPWHVIF